MASRTTLFSARFLSLTLAIGSIAACAAPRGGFGSSPDAGANPGFTRPDDDAGTYEPDDFWENDPPPQWCGPGDAPADEVPGGTPECPSDKNKEGCPCDTVGEEAACWPGLRSQRHLGICKDGVTRCVAQGELGRAWGPCEGAVKAKSGATRGKNACACFSKGKWDIDNIVPCFVQLTATTYAAVSTVDGKCPAELSSLQPGEMPQKPSGTWTANRLTADCAGHFKLCYAIKAGDVNAPQANDCVVARVCTQGDYKTANKAQSFPDLPHWVTPDTTCATKFQKNGGYSEMTVTGQSVRCDDVSDDGQPLVFLRTGFCPLTCADTPTAPECQACANDATGEF
jgi:hypothetical protein